MTTALAPAAPMSSAVIEQVLVKGDLRGLSAEQKVGYLRTVCESLGLNPMTQPFAYIVLNGKEVLYAKKDATEQLRKLHGVSILSLTSQRLDDVFVVTANAQDKTGRTDAATGAVAIGSLKGEALANALMKAETKAKRRVTLSICGLGILDETEVDSIPGAHAPAPIVEAPDVPPPALPEGAAYILRVQGKSVRGVSWAEVTFVDAAGVEQTLPTKPDATDCGLAACEQLSAAGVPVRITTAVGPRSGKTVITGILRWSDAQAAENAVIDAEIASTEPVL